MKKKIALLLLVVVILPIVALFGCDEVSSYPVLVYSSSIVHGSVSGNGTYKDGETVTLTATAKNTKSNSSHFICWLYENDTQLVDDATYEISEVLDDKQLPTKSTLKFKISEQTKGNYIAVFEEEKMMYAKLDNFKIRPAALAGSALNDDENSSNLTANISISQAQNASLYETIYSDTDIEINGASASHPDINNVLKMTVEPQQHILVDLELSYPQEKPAGDKETETKTVSYTMRATLGYRIDMSEQTQVPTSGYSYIANYSNGSYLIKFFFKIEEADYALVLEYKDLSLDSTANES